MILVHVYPCEGIDGEEIGGYIRAKAAGTRVDIKEAFLEGRGNRGEVAERLAGLRVSDPTKRELEEPLKREVELEERGLQGEVGTKGIVYEGVAFQMLLRDLLPKKERNLRHCHIIFTPRLIATWDEDDRRYHARVIVCGFPSIISTSGMVEAPAKPREFYIEKQLSPGTPIEVIKERFKGRFLDYGDARTTEVAKGYAMQALFYHATFSPFCDSKKCRLFNAHWQEEMLEAQLSRPDFCERHEAMLKGLANLY